MSAMPPRSQPRHFEQVARFLRVLAAQPHSERFLMGGVVSGGGPRPFATLVAAVLRQQDLDFAEFLAEQAVAAAEALAPAELEALDGQLFAAGAGTMARRLDRRAAELAAIQARGRIVSEDEYMLVRGRAVHLSRQREWDEERQAVEAMLSAWDQLQSDGYLPSDSGAG
ncbi:MAG TPA: hypothetical protein VM166_09660 [Gemmatimonadaceae bacterium]|nr:hypothetical protein [Gemmatimonadaceae bacterium]